MKKIGFIIFAVAIMIGVVFANFFSWGKAGGKIFNFSVNFAGEKGSGRMGTDVRDLKDFSSIDVGGVFQVEVTAQSDFHVEIEADDNLIQYIRTEVNDGKLEISLEKKVSTKNPLRIRISAPNVESLEASGASNVKVSNLKNSSLKVDSSGASKIAVSGETSEFSVEVSGASKVDADGLTSVNADVDASGASRVSLNVSGKLISDASGASSITYSGTPSSIEKHTSGASSVSPR